VLGVFAKVVRGQQVKTRLQAALARPEAERFHVSSLADTLETALRVVEAGVLFLQGGEDSGAVADLRRRLEAAGLDPALWSRLRLRTQRGADLGERLEAAFEELGGHASGSASERRPAFIIGSDSPSLEAGILGRGLELIGIRSPHNARASSGAARSARYPGEPLSETPPGEVFSVPAPGEVRRTEHSVPDVVLGPTPDGGYWGIGVRRPTPGLLRGVAWSSSRALGDTVERARSMGLGVRLIETWMDVDRPEDLPTLARQIAACRARGDLLTARHSEAALRGMGAME
jgi:glycosyltransferase A (GT-A) superfamily protein (DUF2064 family)